MDESKIKALEQEATDNWYEDGEPIQGIPTGHIKVYTYGKYRETEVYLYDDFVVVYYTPTGIMRKFTDKQRGFDFAKARNRHVGALTQLMR